MDFDQLMKAMDSATVSERGEYLLEGQHTLELKRLLCQKSLKTSLVCEFNVIETTSTVMAAGETRVAIFDTTKQGWQNRWMGLACALLRIEGAQRDTADALAAVKQVTAAVFSSEHRVKSGLEENFFKGRRVACEGTPGTIKNGPHAGEKITNFRWSPA